MSTDTVETNETHQSYSRQLLIGKSSYVLLIIGIVGVCLRVYHYLYNRSLWGDEAFISVNFLGNQWKNLFNSPLLYFQQAPLGFLLIEKTFVTLFGPSEYVLRLFPLVCGIASICLFVMLGKRFLSEQVLALPLSLFVLGYPNILHSVQVKQYSLELLVSLVLYILYLRHKNSQKTRDSVLLGLAGAAATWFSYSSVFILTTFFFLMTLGIGRRKEWYLIPSYLGIFSAWAIGFLPNYIYFIKAGSSISWLSGMWENRFMPLSPAIFQWLPKTFILLIQDPLAISWDEGKTAMVFLGGLVGTGLLFSGWLRLARQDKEMVLLFTLPLLGALAASALKLYPFHGRLLLFSIPPLLIILGKGFEYMLLFPKHKTITFYLVSAIVLAPPIYNTVKHIYTPASFPFYADYRTGIEFIAKHNKKDSVYIPAVLGMSSIEAAFNFYNQTKNYNLKHKFLTNERIVADNREQLTTKMQAVITGIKTQKAFWVFANPNVSAKINSRKPLDPYLNEIDILLEAIQNTDATIDMSATGDSFAAYHVVFRD